MSPFVVRLTRKGKIMKYYSDTLGKLFDTEEALEKAEAVHKEEEEKKAELATRISKEKKELATRIDDTEKKLDEAYKDLDAARERAREIQKEALKKIEEVLHPAEERVKNAQMEKLKAVKEFNEKYGVFTTKLTGAKAAEEMSRVWRAFDSFFDGFFR